MMGIEPASQKRWFVVLPTRESHGRRATHQAMACRTSDTSHWRCNRERPLNPGPLGICRSLLPHYSIPIYPAHSRLFRQASHASGVRFRQTSAMPGPCTPPTVRHLSATSPRSRMPTRRWRSKGRRRRRPWDGPSDSVAAWSCVQRRCRGR